jgi:hypothetical protein
MKTIEQIYQPYNFSATQCYVIMLEISQGNYMKVEHKLPRHIRNLKGIYVSTSRTTITSEQVAFISLNFNGQSLKCFHSPLSRTIDLDDCSSPFPMDEIIKENSFIQGFYTALDFDVKESAYTVTIYLHYLP